MFSSSITILFWHLIRNCNETLDKTHAISEILDSPVMLVVDMNAQLPHTEPFFKLYNLLKIEDIYKFRLLVLYHNISHLKTPQYLDIFLPNTSQGNIHYAMRNPRLQLPVHFHEFIKTTCRYQLPTLLNNLNSESEILKHVIANIETTTLLGLKRIMKNYFLDKYSYFCHIPDCYICGLT